MENRNGPKANSDTKSRNAMTPRPVIIDAKEEDDGEILMKNRVEWEQLAVVVDRVLFSFGIMFTFGLTVIFFMSVKFSALSALASHHFESDALDELLTSRKWFIFYKVRHHQGFRNNAYHYLQKCISDIYQYMI